MSMNIRKKIKYIVIFISFSIVLAGLIKINIINTKALSPLGNSKENYEKIKEAFGEEFADFINDHSQVKIYKDYESGNILIRIGDNDYIVKKESYISEKIEDAKEGVEDIYEDIYNAFIE